MGRQYDLAVLADSPMLYWRLDEGSGTSARDLSTNGRDGTYVGSPTMAVPGVLVGEKAVRVSAHRIERADETPLDFLSTATFSLEAWFKFWQIDGTLMRVWSKEVFGAGAQGYGLLYQSNAGQFTAQRAQAGAFDQATYNKYAAPNVWHQIVMTYDGTTILMYIDGLQVATVGSAKLLQDTTSVISMGQGFDGSRSFNGDLARGSVYSTALSAARVAEHYRTGLIVDLYGRGAPRARDRVPRSLIVTPTSIFRWFMGAAAGGGITQPVELAVTATGTVALIRMPGKVFAVTATGTPTLLKQVQRAFSVTATGSPTLLKQVGRTFTITATGTPTLLKMPGKVLAVTATATVSLLRQAGKVLAVTATGTVTLLKMPGKVLSLTANATVSLLKRAGKVLTVTATGTPFLTVIKVAVVILSVTATAAVSLIRMPIKVLAVTATSTPSLNKLVAKTLAVTSTVTVFLEAIKAAVGGAAKEIIFLLRSGRLAKRITDEIYEELDDE